MQMSYLRNLQNVEVTVLTGICQDKVQQTANKTIPWYQIPGQLIILPRTAEPYSSSEV